MVRILSFCCQGCWFNPWSVNLDPINHTAWGKKSHLPRKLSAGQTRVVIHPSMVGVLFWYITYYVSIWFHTVTPFPPNSDFETILLKKELLQEKNRERMFWILKSWREDSRHGRKSEQGSQAPSSGDLLSLRKKKEGDNATARKEANGAGMSGSWYGDSMWTKAESPPLQLPCRANSSLEAIWSNSSERHCVSSF